jgi:drug/metabolite transporter (DMT)-like permease
MYSVNFALLYWGEQWVPSGIAAVLYATMPLTTAAFAAMLHVHPLERAKLVAALIGLVGVCLIFSGEIRVGAPVVPLVGVFLAATTASLGNVLLKRAPVQSTWVVNTIGCAIGTVFCGLSSLLLREPWVVPREPAQWGPLLYLVLLGNLGAYALFTWMVTQWTVTRLMIGSLIIPVIAVILGALVRSEAPAPATYLGAAVVLLAVAVSMRPPGRTREAIAGQEK